MALIASLISIRAGISVALIEIVVGVIAGNLAVGLEGGALQFSLASATAESGGLHHVLQSTEWTNFLALLGSGVLTFLAGAEIDPLSLKANWRASVLIGTISFAAPFAAAWLIAQFVFGWSLHEAQLAGIALSTTSVAVVYAVMIEGGFSDTAMGKMILAACFITDFGTVLALGTLFANFNLWLLVFIIVMCVFLWFMPRSTRFIIGKFGATRVSEPEVKFIFFILFFLGGLASSAKTKRSSSVSRWFSGGGSLPPRQNARTPNAQHRVCGVYAVLLHQGRPLRVAARSLGGPFRHRDISPFEDGDENCRRFPVGSLALHEGKGGNLYDAVDGYGPDLWNDLLSIRIAEPHHRSKAIHDPCERRHFERVRADIDRAKVFPADHRGNARLGPPLSSSTWHALS